MQEIAEARWMTVSEYSQQEFVRGRPAIHELSKCVHAYCESGYKGFGCKSLAFNETRGPELLAHGLHTHATSDQHMPDGWENT